MTSRRTISLRVVNFSTCGGWLSICSVRSYSVGTPPGESTLSRYSPAGRLKISSVLSCLPERSSTAVPM
jgi:hypothetical protein